jgi:transposase
MMRGTDEAAGLLFSCVGLDERLPARHPMRKVRQIVNEALFSMDGAFDQLHSTQGRPCIAPERLRAGLVQMPFSVRSERQLMEQMHCNLLFRWFVGLGIDDPVWVPRVFEPGTATGC